MIIDRKSLMLKQGFSATPHWHLGLEDSLMWGVLGPGGCGAASLVSTHHVPGGPSASRWWDQKCPTHYQMFLPSLGQHLSIRTPLGTYFPETRTKRQVPVGILPILCGARYPTCRDRRGTLLISGLMGQMVACLGSQQAGQPWVICTPLSPSRISLQPWCPCRSL